MPNSRFALHGNRPFLIHGLCAFFLPLIHSKNAPFSGRSGPLLTPVSTAPFFARLSVHGLHFTVYAPSSGENKKGEKSYIAGYFGVTFSVTFGATSRVPWSHNPDLLNGRLGNCKIGGCKETRQPFANLSPTLRQPFGNLLAALCQPFLPTPL